MTSYGNVPDAAAAAAVAVAADVVVVAAATVADDDYDDELLCKRYWINFCFFYRTFFLLISCLIVDQYRLICYIGCDLIGLQNISLHLRVLVQSFISNTKCTCMLVQPGLCVYAHNIQ